MSTVLFYPIEIGQESIEKQTKILPEASDFFRYKCVHDILKVTCVATLYM